MIADQLLHYISYVCTKSERLISALENRLERIMGPEVSRENLPMDESVAAWPDYFRIIRINVKEIENNIDRIQDFIDRLEI